MQQSSGAAADEDVKESADALNAPQPMPKEAEPSKEVRCLF